MEKFIEIIGAKSHNLKNINCKIPRGKITVITGVSGSGKSTLAFDTLFAEGQRRYIESLSTYARQFLEKMDRPDVEAIHGIPPAIAIEQKNSVKNARSTVGTASEIYDYLRLLYAKIGEVFCPQCHIKVSGDTVESVVEQVLSQFTERKIFILSPVSLENGQQKEDKVKDLIKNGYYRVWEKGQTLDLTSLTASEIDQKFSPSPSPLPTGRQALPPGEREKGTLSVLIDRLLSEGKERSRLSEAIQKGFQLGNGKVDVVTEQGERITFNRSFSCNRCGRNFSEPEPLLFSFNSPLGACRVCQGFGRIIGIDWQKVIPDPKKTLKEKPFAPWNTPAYEDLYEYLWKACRRHKIPTQKPFEELLPQQKDILINGRGEFIGLKGFFEWMEGKRYKVHYRVFLSKYRAYTPCPTCHNTRLKEEALYVLLAGKNIAELCDMPISDLQLFFKNLPIKDFQRKVGERLLKEINDRIGFMVDVGLGYLTLSRQTRTLSSGEYQRITLARSLGSSLTETLYVLDEPSIGLHARDTHRLLRSLRKLRESGNTAVVVEHDPDVIRAADEVIDLGPGAGRSGGSVVFQGGLESLLQSQDSITARYLRNGTPSAQTRSLRKPQGWISIRNAREHNLKGIDVRIPLGVMACITGVSGAGKTTLVHNILYAGAKGNGDSGFEKGAFDFIKGLEQIHDLILVDQSPIGKSLRSNSATYIKVFSEIRDLFAQTREAKRYGFKPRHFSFNTEGGRCETCQGAGFQVLDMQFLEDVIITCETCEGKRFRPEILKVNYRDKNISEVLNMTVDEAITFFQSHHRILQKLQTLKDVGLGYLTLGQSTNTLSGGESQRLKLAQHIGQSHEGKNLFIFDEPTTGLHMADVELLLMTFEKLLSQGHSIIVIEHNLDLIRCADYIIDLGPEGGEEGGRIVAEGDLRKIMASPQSYTGQFLRQRLQQQSRNNGMLE
ncbi:MAG TPA: excinuclease ABC subunit UvrA [Thermodesulfobacteriota bacterium]|nr:excinuclease ABC subunit UvrA [Thermodesulfobacteriota bacterium]